ncbi:hypothetical protein M011DRAFT_456080 [Sporormia fimetaria CBS 119925]|uniref:Uncharacterized protein n=1 Tax=Sporormia fimetaria CBS 119925 TaxID=1340428 RepID=A0A6A6VK04_9PLEO|nr:hypothetical protein M011DRAFT_456080 [Sporormia fimetaria CBS 119925]
MPQIPQPGPTNQYNLVLTRPFASRIPETRIEIIGEQNRGNAQIKMTRRSGDNLEIMEILEGDLKPKVQPSPHRLHTDTDTLCSDDLDELFDYMDYLSGLPSSPDEDIYDLDRRLSFQGPSVWDNGGDETTGELDDEARDLFDQAIQFVEDLGRSRARRPTAI